MRSLRLDARTWPALRAPLLLAIAPLLLGACSALGIPTGEPSPSEQLRTATAPAAAARPGTIATPAYPGPTIETATELPTATATASPTPALSPTSAPTRTPTPSTLASPLYVDSEGGEIFASQDVGGEALLLRYRSVDGKLVDAHAIREGEQLLGLDDAGRLHLRQPEIGLRVIDAWDYETIAEMPFSTLALSNVIEAGPFRYGPPRPILHPESGRVFAFEDRTVWVVDPLRGEVMEEIELPPHEGPIVEAVLSADGRYLYVLLTTSDGSFPLRSTIHSIDAREGSLVDRRDYGPAVRRMRGLGNHVVASGAWPGYGGVGHFLDHWTDGHPVQILTNAPRLYYGVYDSRRDRILARVDIFGPGEPLRVFDGSTLGPLFLASVDDFGSPEVYDETTDRFFGRGRVERLQVFDPSTLAPDPLLQEPAASIVSADGVSVVHSWLPGSATRGEPMLMTGVKEVPPPPSSEIGIDWRQVISRDGGETWELDERSGIPSDWDCTSPSPDFLQDQTVFACAEGGVYGSEDAGRSWSPLGPGITTQEIREIRVSPAFSQDQTLFVSSFERHGDPLDRHAWEDEPAESAEPRPKRDTAWRSEDAGATWEPIGHVATLLLDDDFAESSRVFAFEHRGSQLLVSEDGGRSWERRGRLPAVANRLWIVPATASTPRVLLALASTGVPPVNGMIPKWPSLDSRLYRSVDEGSTWEPVWPPEDDSEGSNPNTRLLISLDYSTVHGRLMGPLDAGAEGPTWLLEPGLGGSTVLLSQDALHWAPYHLPDEPVARFLGLREDGTLLFSGGDAGVEEVSLDALEPGIGRPEWRR